MIKHSGNQLLIGLALAGLSWAELTLPAEAQITPITITSLTLSNRTVTIRWQGGNENQPYQLQKLLGLSGDRADVEAPTFGKTVKIAMSDQAAFYQVAQNGVRPAAALFDQDPPTVPTGVQGYAASCAQVVLYWNAATDNPGGSGVKGYFIYRDGAFLAQGPSWSTSFLDSGLISPSTSYTYAILAVDAAGNASSLSPTVTVATPVCNDPNSPSTPMGLVATPANSNQIDLVWNRSTNGNGSGIAVYNVYRNGRFLKAVPAPDTSTSDAGLTPKTTYAYTVSAVNTLSHQSGQSSVAVATTCETNQQDTTPPFQPTNLAATVVSCLAIDVFWGAATDNPCGTGVKSYVVYRDGIFIASVTTPETGYSDTNITQSGAHRYTVAAIDVAGNQSVPSEPVNASTVACACTANISISSTTGGTASGAGVFNCGSSITVTAAPSAGFSFANWTESGTVVSTSAKYTFGASANRSLVANFASASYTISASSSPFSAGTTSGGGTFISGSVVTLTATAASGYSFLSWTENGTVVSTSANYTFTAASNRNLVANFAAASPACNYTLSPTSAPFGSSGGASNFNMTASVGCSWAATTANSWISIQSGSSGTGNGTVNYTVAANFSASSRAGSILAGGQTFSIVQAGSSNPDNTPPAAVLNSPGNGTTLSNTITLSASANDGTGGSGVTRVEFYVDNMATPLATSTIAPYSVFFDTTILANGSHSFYAKAYDAAGNSAPSLSVTATVINTESAGSPGQSQWSLVFGSGQPSDAAYATAVALDRNGNPIVAGRFTGSANIGAVTLTGASGYGGFVAKFTPGGSLVWVKQLGGADFAGVKSIAVDVNNNILVAGIFIGTIDFGGGPLTAAAVPSSFLVKYSTTGVLFWAKAFGGPCNATVNAVAADSGGNVIFAGYMSAGPGGVNFGTGQLVSDNGQAVFVAKVSPTGSTFWSRRFGGAPFDPSAYSQAKALAIDGSGNALIAGDFSGTLDFGTGPVASAGGRDIFLAKCSGLDGSIDGGTHWAHTFGDNQDQFAYGLAVDPAGDILVTGNFLGLLNFGGGSLTSSGSLTIFLAKLSSSGTDTRWANSFTNALPGSNNPDYPGGITVDTGGNILLTGSVIGDTDFGGGPLSSSGASDIFAAKFSSGGGYTWARRFPGSNSGSGLGIAVDGSGGVLLGGWFSRTVDFVPGQFSTLGIDAFLLRLSP